MGRVRKQRLRAIDLERGMELEDHGKVTVMTGNGVTNTVRLETEGGFKDDVRAAELFYVIFPAASRNAEGPEAD